MQNIESPVSRATFDECCFPCYVPQDMVLTHGQGCLVYDDQGNEYHDLSAGIAVNCLGHNHEAVVKTISEQASKLIHVSNIFVNNQTLKLAQKLVQITDFERVFFVNSGAEANEAALKLARRVAFDLYGEQKDEIISFNQSFHGRTLFTVSVGGQKKYSSGFGPTPEGIVHLPFNDLEALKAQISNKTCAVIFEPIQGEGGIIKSDPEFMKGARELCNQFNALLIFDEVQTGVGRTGSLYAYQDYGVVPDILTTAKGLAAGIPIGAVLTMSKWAEHFKPGTHGSTFGGNPLACAVANTVLEIVNTPEFLAHVQNMSQELVAILEEINQKEQIFKEIRGKGLLLGAVLKDQYAHQAGLLQKCCSEHKLLTLTAGDSILRLTPPLIIDHKFLQEVKGLLEQACASFLAKV